MDSREEIEHPQHQPRRLFEMHLLARWPTSRLKIDALSPTSFFFPLRLDFR